MKQAREPYILGFRHYPPLGQEHGERWRDIPGQARHFPPLFVGDGLVPPRRDGLLAGNVQIGQRQRVMPRAQTLDLIGQQ